jgi:drug/metabolite transporter (DMT)-like permease
LSAIALSLALFAACLHATWNAMVKVAPDRALVLAAIAAAHTATGLVLMNVAGVPASESWPFIAASTLLHYVYYLFLFESYRFGDLSQVYPIARGMAPLLVASGAWIFAGEALSLLAWIAIFITSAGIMAIAVIRRNPLKSDPRTLAYTIANGVIIAAYSIVDGIGVRLSGDPLGYMAWLFFLEFPVVIVIVALRRGALPAFARSGMSLALAGGLLSVVAYGIVLYANTLAPLGAVSAVRESSVIIAALIGTLLLGETPRLPRLGSAALVATGIVILAIVR